MPTAPQKTSLAKLARSLSKHGLATEAERLLELGRGLDDSLKGASWFARNSGKVKAVLGRHARNVSVEWRETAHLLRVARQLLVERRAVSAPDMELARSQLLDLLKTVPASAIVAGTFLIPVPGAQPILAPVLMERLGLLPSAWSETAMESELRDLVQIARDRKLADISRELESVLATVRSHKADLKRFRRYVEENPDWAVFFDENLDSRISDGELSVLRARVDVAARFAITAPDDPGWSVYFRGDQHEDKVIANLTFTQIRSGFPDSRNALVRRGDTDWWVPLWAVLEQLG